MGRQKGDPNRSKNRPSSSSAAASLLQNSRGVAAGFGGYVGSSRVDVPDLQDNEQPMVEVDGEAALHLRRLSKKDSTTRLKALKALIVLFKEWPASELCQLLPIWIFEYKKLVHDDNQQVRECTHNAMSAMSATVGRGLAPHLRMLMGAWWVSQFDSSKDVSAAAKQSFQVAFQGPSKRLEALMFCATDILLHIGSLLILSLQTITDKLVPMEESTRKYELVISSALLALAAFLDTILQHKKPSFTPDHENFESDKGKSLTKKIQDTTKEVEESAARLCSSHKHFRDFFKSKSSQIRCASYQALCAFARNAISVFGVKDLEGMAGIVLGSFSEKDPSCHSAMWDMVLYFTQQYPEMWNTNATNKFILPRFFSFLRHATYGSAKVSYPCILPFLSLLPSQSINLSTQFLKDLFSSLWEGHSAYNMGVEDERVFLNTFQECFLWVMNNADRFFAGQDSPSMDSIHEYMMANVFIEILWKNYTFCGFQAPSDSVPPIALRKHGIKTAQENTELLLKKQRERYSTEFVEMLRICIIDVLSNLSAKFKDPVYFFWKSLPDLCLEAVMLEARQEMDSPPITRMGCALRTGKFLSQFGRSCHTDDCQKQDIVNHAIRSLVAKLFPIVSSRESCDAIRLLSAIVSAFGPLSFHIPEVTEEQAVFDSEFESVECSNNDLDGLFSFLEKNLIPWCLEPFKPCVAERVELLLSFFEDERLVGKWNSVLFHALTIEDNESEPGQLNSKRMAVLSVLLERFRLKFLDLDSDESGRILSTSKWDLSGLDGVAIKVAGSLSLPDPSALQLLRQIVGGSGTTNFFCLVAPETVDNTFKVLLYRLQYVLPKSGKEWASFAAEQLRMPADVSLLTVEDRKATSLSIAAAQALADSITYLQLANKLETTSRVIATFYCIQWAFEFGCYSNDKEEEAQFEHNGKNTDSASVLCMHSDSSCVENEDENPNDLSESLVENGFLVEGVNHAFRSIALVLSNGFSRHLNESNRSEVQRILVQCIRFAAFEGTSDAQKMAHVWGRRVKGWMDQMCNNAEDLQHFLDMLLEPTNIWPLYVSNPARADSFTIPVDDRFRLSSEATTSKHERFAALIVKVASFMGWRKLLGCQRSEQLEYVELASKGKSLELDEQCRIWLIVEMLCTWHWPGGDARQSLILFLVACVENEPTGSSENILDCVISSLFLSATSRQKISDFNNKYWLGSFDNVEEGEDRCLHALLFLLNEVCRGDKKVQYSEKLFQMLVVDQGLLEGPVSHASMKVLPFILSIVMPALRKQQDKVEPELLSSQARFTLEAAVIKWLRIACSAPPLSLHNDFFPDLEDALQVVVAFFPLHLAGGSVAVMAAASANVSAEERSLLRSLMQKEMSEGAGFVTHVAKHYASHGESLIKKDARLFHEEILAKLLASSIAYCWKDFTSKDWAYVTHHMRKWMEAAVIEQENFTHHVIDSTAQERGATMETTLSVVEKIRVDIEAMCVRKSDLSWTAVIIFSLLQVLQCPNSMEPSFSVDTGEASSWKEGKARILSYIAQIFFASGMNEALALDSAAGEAASSAIASYRLSNVEFWEIMSEILLCSTIEERKEIFHHLNTWTVGKDSVRSLYAILFCSQPIGRMQHAAYNLLTDDPFQSSAVICRSLKDRALEEGFSIDSTESLPLNDVALRPELSRLLETCPTRIFESSLVSSIRVQYFLAWAIVLSYIRSKLVSSEIGEKLVQYIQDSAVSTTILDSIFQHIPLNSEPGLPKRKSSSQWQAETDRVGDAARRACALGSVSSAIEGLWPIDEGTVSFLAAGLYGLLLQVLPAFVRVWFTGLRDRSVGSSVESFTTKFCSPLILADEFAQVHNSTVNSTVADDSLAIKANQSLGEVIVIYKKEEAGMDMTIKLPKCYPLKAVDIDCTRRLGVSETRLRKWTISMAAFLRNQNGAVAEAIQIWRQNVDREFEGVEECPICYSVIHTANHSLPKLACKTCKHKFHAPCLYKWFSTSHKSTCPLCQTPF